MNKKQNLPERGVAGGVAISQQSAHGCGDTGHYRRFGGITGVHGHPHICYRRKRVSRQFCGGE
jgi:hypothetical protein